MQAAPRDNVTAILGPTNTGKTHFAIERMLSHASGMIGLPLRLLAREVFEKIKDRAGAGRVALITGEEKITPPRPSYYVCTAEAMPTEISVDCLIIDEVQLCGDPDRGHVFTNRVLHSRGMKETLFLGAASAGRLLETLLGGVVTKPQARFSKLAYAGPKKISRLPRRTAVVAFSTEAVYAIAELIRRQRGGAAVVMGALSPRSRNAQADLFHSGDVDFLVATDAIGMGLNMDLAHVAFAGLSKFDGRRMRRLTPGEIAQIAGRAGRHTKDGTFGVTADCSELDAETIEAVEEHRFEPLRFAYWRNRNLAFDNLAALLHSLDAKPRHAALRRSPVQDDQETLKRLTADGALRDRLKDRAMVRLLWDVCQIPDFRKTSPEEHARLVGRIFDHLSGPYGVISNEWFAGMIDRLDRIDGDVDALSTRIAHVRTWTYVAHRPGWLRDPAGWRARTRLLEDKLSDALHARLTQRFVDRRTSALIKGLRGRDALAASVSADGEVRVEGHRVGRVLGLNAEIETGASGAEARAVNDAARRVMGPELKRRAQDIIRDRDEFFRLEPDGTVLWRAGLAGRVSAIDDNLTPDIRLADEEFVEGALRAEVVARLRTFVTNALRTKLGAVFQIRRLIDAPDTPLSPAGRAFAFRWLETTGVAERKPLDDEIRALNDADRKALRASGLKIGRWTVHAPDALGPDAVRMRALIERLKGRATADAPPPGVTSFAANGARAEDCALYGFRLTGPRAIRVDILERLDGLIRKRMRENDGRGFIPDVDMLALLGCGREDLENVLKAMGFAPRGPRPKPAETHAPKGDAGAGEASSGTSNAVTGAEAPSEGSSTVESAPEAAAAGEDVDEARPSPTAADTQAAGGAEAETETPSVKDTPTPQEPRKPAMGEAAAVSASEEKPEKTNDEVVFWGPARAKRSRHGERHKRGAPRPDNKAKGGENRPAKAHKPKKGAQRGGPERAARPPKPIDPDNPFAKLAELQFPPAGKGARRDRKRVTTKS